ncbi:MAG TPA: hypothetical protein V6D33_04055 [Cyanophyceae cyanobacterium]
MSWALLIAAVIVSILIFGFLVRVVKAAIGTAIAIAVVALILQLGFGIAPNQLKQEMLQLWTNFLEQFNG